MLFRSRLLDKSRRAPTLEELGMSDPMQESIRIDPFKSFDPQEKHHVGNRV